MIYFGDSNASSVLSQADYNNQKLRIERHLKSLAPYSIVEQGLNFATLGAVSECTKKSNKISARVNDKNEDTVHAVTLEVISSNQIKAFCSCSTEEQMNEQWCSHAVATLWKSYDLGFFFKGLSFTSELQPLDENLQRVSSHNVASVINELSELTKHESDLLAEPLRDPEVSIRLFTSTYLGAQFFLNQDLARPAVFGRRQQSSNRELDNLLYRVLDEKGSWNEERENFEFPNSSDSDLILGLAREYKKVTCQVSGAQLTISKCQIRARLNLTWATNSLNCSMVWLLEDSELERTSDCIVIGDPSANKRNTWVRIGDIIYKLSEQAERIAALFSSGAAIRYSRSECAPILEAISAGKLGANIEIINPKLQPQTEIVVPTPLINLERTGSETSHFLSRSTFELSASLSFKYPHSPSDRNVVFLRNREKEAECLETMKQLGFSYDASVRRHRIKEEKALDLIYRGIEAFEPEWQVSGLEDIISSVRIAELELSINLALAHSLKLTNSGQNFSCEISLAQSSGRSKIAIPISSLFKQTSTEPGKWIYLPNGSYAIVPGGDLKILAQTLAALDPGYRLSNVIKTTITYPQALSISLLRDKRIKVNLDKHLTELAGKLSNFSQIEALKPTRKFKGKLRSYQSDGLSWLRFLHEFKLGGILADEMGLGKTVQALAFLQFIKDKKLEDSTFPSLVVCPTSVVTNWFYEAQRFTPDLKVLLLHGPGRREKFNQIGDCDLALTTYALLRHDRSELSRQEFNYVILDEAQYIKNPSASTTQSAKSLKARRRVVLTGTPAENRPLELWSIFDFLMPSFLGSQEFFKKNIERFILDENLDEQFAVSYLRQKTRPFILRRTKAQVEKDLPPKIESTLPVNLTSTQRELYNQTLEEVRPLVFGAIEKRGIKGASVHILAALMRLRQICNHPNSLAALRNVPGYDSGKFNLLRDIVPQALDSGRKILLFSQFREMLSIIRRWLDDKKFNGQKAQYLYLDGHTRDRQSLIDRFNSDEEIRLFLISLKAGGTGLNLTAADTVIIYDPWWNPAVEDQAVDRAHRIGQTKAVSVYRLVTEHTIEKKIMGLKEKKSKIVDSLVNESALAGLNLSRKDLENLFTPLPADN